MGAQAQSLNPGLWEITQKLGGSPKLDAAQAQMQQQMASMPPEQRKMVEDMLARQGVKLGAAAGGSTSIKVCLTQEMVSRNELPMQTRGNCKSTTSDRSASGMKMAFACTSPPSSGEGQITFSGPDAYTMKMVVNTAVQGKPETLTMDSAARWQGADCGSVKPLAVPTP
jgi:hypothetical protein